MSMVRLVNAAGHSMTIDLSKVVAIWVFKDQGQIGVTFAMIGGQNIYGYAIDYDAVERDWQNAMAREPLRANDMTAREVYEATKPETSTKLEAQIAQLRRDKIQLHIDLAKARDIGVGLMKQLEADRLEDWDKCSACLGMGSIPKKYLEGGTVKGSYPSWMEALSAQRERIKEGIAWRLVNTVFRNDRKAYSKLVAKCLKKGLESNHENLMKIVKELGDPREW